MDSFLWVAPDVGLCGPCKRKNTLLLLAIFRDKVTLGGLNARDVQNLFIADYRFMQ